MLASVSFVRIIDEDRTVRKKRGFTNYLRAHIGLSGSSFRFGGNSFAKG